MVNKKLIRDLLNESACSHNKTKKSMNVISANSTLTVRTLLLLIMCNRIISRKFWFLLEIIKFATQEIPEALGAVQVKYRVIRPE